MKTTFIYRLVDPRDNNKCYVGKANNPLKRLLEGHLLPSNLKKRTRKNSWVKSLLKLGLRPKLEIIDEVNYNEWQFWEQHYISLYKSWGFNLTNETNGGDAPPPHQDLSLEKQKVKIEKQKQTKKNWTVEKYNSFVTKLSLVNLGVSYEQKFGKEQAKLEREKRRQGVIKSYNKTTVQYNLLGEELRVWSSAKEAEYFYNKRLTATNISACCNKKQKTAYGFKWEYKSNNETKTIS